jgi:hypothetical protein
MKLPKVNALDKIEHFLIPDYLKEHINGIIKWLLIGYLIRLIVMPLFVQSDLVNNGFLATTLIKEGYWLPSSYSPLFFYIYGGWLKLFQPIMPYGIFWDIPALINFGTNPNQWTTSILLRLSDPNTFSFLFVSKALYLIPDLVVSLSLLRLFSKPKEGLFAFKFWLLNPILIFVTYIIGQFDVFVVAFLMLSMMAFYRKNYILSAVFLGIGAAFKIILLPLLPMVLLPLLANRTNLQKLKNAAIALAVSALPLVLSYLTLMFIPTHAAGYNLSTNSPTFSIFGLFLDRTIALTATSVFNDYLFVFVFVYFCLMILYYLLRDYSFDAFWKFTLAIFLLYYSFSFFHVQWFLWVQPLIILAIVKYRRLFPIYLVTLVGYAGYLLYLDAAVTTDLILPIYPSAISWVSPLKLISNMGFQPPMILGIFRTLLSAGCVALAIFVLWTIYKDRQISKVQKAIE